MKYANASAANSIHHLRHYGIRDGSGPTLASSLVAVNWVDYPVVLQYGSRHFGASQNPAKRLN